MLLPPLWTIEGKCLLIVWWIELANRLQGTNMVNSTNQNYTPSQNLIVKKREFPFLDLMSIVPAKTDDISIALTRTTD